jgi:hypothetical protein
LNEPDLGHDKVHHRQDVVKPPNEDQILQGRYS